MNKDKFDMLQLAVKSVFETGCESALSWTAVRATFLGLLSVDEAVGSSSNSVTLAEKNLINKEFVRLSRWVVENHKSLVMNFPTNDLLFKEVFEFILRLITEDAHSPDMNESTKKTILDKHRKELFTAFSGVQTDGLPDQSCRFYKYVFSELGDPLRLLRFAGEWNSFIGLLAEVIYEDSTLQLSYRDANFRQILYKWHTPNPKDHSSSIELKRLFDKTSVGQLLQHLFVSELGDRSSQVALMDYLPGNANNMKYLETTLLKELLLSVNLPNEFQRFQWVLWFITVLVTASFDSTVPEWDHPVCLGDGENEAVVHQGIKSLVNRVLIDEIPVLGSVVDFLLMYFKPDLFDNPEWIRVFTVLLPWAEKVFAHDAAGNIKSARSFFTDFIVQAMCLLSEEALDSLIQQEDFKKFATIVIGSSRSSVFSGLYIKHPLSWVKAMERLACALDESVSREFFTDINRYFIQYHNYQFLSALLSSQGGGNAFGFASVLEEMLFCIEHLSERDLKPIPYIIFSLIMLHLSIKQKNTGQVCSSIECERMYNSAKENLLTFLIQVAIYSSGRQQLFLLRAQLLNNLSRIDLSGLNGSESLNFTYVVVDQLLSELGVLKWMDTFMRKNNFDGGVRARQLKRRTDDLALPAFSNGGL
jgi:hypothetical protein